MRLGRIVVGLILVAGLVLTPTCAMSSKWSFQEAAKPYRGKILRLAAEAYSPIWAYTEIAKDFERDTGIKVEIEPMEYSQLLEKVTADLAGKTGYYDVFAWNTLTLGRVAANKWAYTNDEFANRADITRPDFNPGEEFGDVYEAACYFDNKYWGVPYQYLPPGWIYQRKLAEHPNEQNAFKERYGYDMPIPPQTWEQYYQLAEFFTRKKGERLAGEVLTEDFYGTCVALKRHVTAAYHLQIFVVGMGGEGLLYNNGEIAAETPVFQKALEFYMSLRPFSTPAHMEYMWDELNRDAMLAKFFMVQIWPDVMVYLENPDEAPKMAGQVGYFTAPESKTIWADTHTWFISKYSKNPDVGWLWFQYLSTREAQAKYQKLGGSTFRFDVLRDPEIMAVSPWVEGYILDSKVAPTLKEQIVPEMLDLISEACSRIGAGDMSVSEGAKWIADQQRQLLERSK